MVDVESRLERAEFEGSFFPRRLEDLDFPEGALVGAILRDHEVIVPRGPDRIRADDEVIVFALPEAIPAVEALFE